MLVSITAGQCFGLLLAATFAALSIGVACEPSPVPWNLTVPLLTKFEYSFRESPAQLSPLAVNDWLITATSQSLIGIRTGAVARDKLAYSDRLPQNATSLFLVNTSRFVAICGKQVFFYGVNATHVWRQKTFSYLGLSFSMAEEFPNQAPLVVNNTIYMGGSNAAESYNCSMLAVDGDGNILRAVSVPFDDCNFAAKMDNNTLLFQVRNNDMTGWANEIVWLFANFTVRKKFSVVYPNGNVHFLPYNNTVFVFYQEGYVIQFNSTGGALNFLSLNDTCGGMEFPPFFLNDTIMFICDAALMEVSVDNATLLRRVVEPLRDRFSFLSVTDAAKEMLLATDVGNVYRYAQSRLQLITMVTKGAYGHVEGVHWTSNATFFLSLSTQFYGGITILLGLNGTVLCQATGQLQPVGHPFYDAVSRRVYVANAAATFEGYDAFVAYDVLISPESFVVDTWANSHLAFPFVRNASGQHIYYAASTGLYVVQNKTAALVSAFATTLVAVTSEIVLLGAYVALFDEVSRRIHIVDTVKRTSMSVVTCKVPYQYVYHPLHVHHGSMWLNCGTQATAAFQRIFPNGTVVSFGTSGGFYPMTYAGDYVIAFTAYNKVSRFQLDPSGGLVNVAWTTTLIATTNPILVGEALYVAGDSLLFAINVSSGAVLNTSSFNQFPRFLASSVVAGRRVFYIVGEKVSAVDGTGSLLFELSIANVLVSSSGLPTVGANGVFAFFTLSTLVALDGITGVTMYTKTVDTDATYSPIVFMEGNIIYSDGFGVVGANPLSGRSHSTLSYTYSVDALRGFEVVPASSAHAPPNSTLVIASQSGFVLSGVFSGVYSNFSGVPIVAPTTTNAPLSTTAPTTKAPAPTTTKAPTTAAQQTTTSSPTTTTATSTAAPTTASTTTMAPPPPTTTGAPQTTVASTTTAAPQTTEAPTTTAAPQTTEAPTTTAAPQTTEAPTTTAAPQTTEAPTTTGAPQTSSVVPQTTDIPLPTTDAPETTFGPTQAPGTAAPPGAAAPLEIMGLSGAPLYATLGVGSCAVALIVAVGVVAVKFLLRPPGAAEEEMLFVEHLQQLDQQAGSPPPPDQADTAGQPNNVPEAQAYEPPINPLENMMLPLDSAPPTR